MQGCLLAGAEAALFKNKKQQTDKPVDTRQQCDGYQTGNAGGRGGEVKYMAMEGKQNLGGEDTMASTDDGI